MEVNMQGNFTEDSWIFRMLSDFYKLNHDYFEVENGKSNYWVEVVEKADIFAKKYQEDSLGYSDKLALEFLNYLERKYKKGG